MATRNPGSSDGVRLLLSKGTVYLISRALQSGAAFLILPLVTRAFSPDDYGTIVTALVVVQLLGVIATAGVPASITLDYFADREREDNVALLVGLSVAVAVVGAGLADLLHPLWLGLFSELHYDAGLRIAIWTAVPIAVLAAGQALLQAEHRAWTFAVVSACSSVGGPLAGVLLAYAFGGRPAMFFIGNAIATTVAAALVLGLYRKLDLRVWRDRALASWALRTGSPTLLHNLSMYIVLAGDRLVLARIAGVETVGRYQIAYVVGTLPLLVLASIGTAWIPLVIGTPEGERWALLRDTSVVLHKLSALMASAIAVGCPLLLLVLAPARYDPRGLTVVATVVGLSTCPYLVMYGHFMRVFRAGSTHVLAWVTTVSAAANILANVALVGRYGMRGSAVATVFTYALQAVLLWFGARNGPEVEWNLKASARPWLLAGVAFVAGALAPTTDPWLVVRGVAMAAFLVAMAVVGWREIHGGELQGLVPTDVADL